MAKRIIHELNPTETREGVFRKGLSDCVILTKDNSLLLQFRPRNPQNIGKISLFGGHIEQGGNAS